MITEYILDKEARKGRTRKLYYKPDNHKWVEAGIVKDNMTKGYMITDIKHGVELPEEVREMKKSEYTIQVLKHLDFIDNYYKNR